MRESDPPHCPPCASRGRTWPADQGLVHAFATTTYRTSALLFHEVDLPVRLLDPHIELTKIASHLISLGT